jgi:hypothetical protein
MTCPGILSGTMSHRDKKSVQIPQSLGDRGIIPNSLKRKRESAEADLARASRFLSVRAGAQVLHHPLRHRFTATNLQAPAFEFQTPILSHDLAALGQEAVGVSGGPQPVVAGGQNTAATTAGGGSPELRRHPINQATLD